MPNAVSLWFSKILLICMCLSPFLIVKEGMQYYNVITCEALTENYIAGLRNGKLDFDEYITFGYRMAVYGYETELFLHRYGQDGYYDLVLEEEISAQTTMVHGRSIYQLQQGDFLCVKLSSKESVIKETLIFRGEGIH